MTEKSAANSEIKEEREDGVACSVGEHNHQQRVPASAEIVERAANLFFALGDMGRLRLLERLLDQEWCVTELAAELDEELSTVSQRLKLLRAHGLVRRRRDGKHIFYSLLDQHIADLISNALAHASETKS
jgi:ArsR family transcriptional regulator, lead/cadmium/zinc/bismuth-responsive transcriptional repressor